jgi:hypothetical protein
MGLFLRQVSFLTEPAGHGLGAVSAQILGNTLGAQQKESQIPALTELSEQPRQTLKGFLAGLAPL